MIKFYIDSVNGSDTTGDGTLKYPYLTIGKCMDMNVFDTEIEIVLKKGEYDIAHTVLANIHTTLTIIGQGIDSIIYINGNYGDWDGKGILGSTLKFKKLTFDCQKMTTYKTGSVYLQWYYYLNVNTSLEFNNVLFRNFNKVSRGDAGNFSNFGFFKTSYAPLYFKNCTFPSIHRKIFDATTFPITVINSYGYITGIYTDSRNVITLTPNLDESFYISDETENGKYVGVYYGGYSWYFTNFIIFMNNKYYSIKDEYFDMATDMFKPIAFEDIIVNGLEYYSVSNMSELMEERNIIYEDLSQTYTFKPIDKFDNFQIIADTNNIIKVKGFKSTDELVVASGDIMISVADNIEYMNLIATASENSDIRIALSKDKGITWLTSDGVEFINLDCIIPLKDYQDMSSEETVQYNIAKSIIAENGMTIDIFNHLNFNTIDAYNIRFAYVLSRNSFDDISEINNLSWKFDAKGYMKELKDNEYDLDIYDQRVQLKSNIANNIVKLSVIT